MRVTPRALGTSVKSIREKAGITQMDLANRMKVSRKWLSSFENGKSNVDFTLVLLLLSELGYQLDLNESSNEKSKNG